MARTLRLLVAVVAALALLSLAQPAPARQASEQPTSGAPVVAKKRPGSAGDHTWLFNKKLTWPSCGALTYRINPSKAPKGWKKLVKKAVKKAKQATHLKFRYLGKTKVKPTHTNANPDDTDLVVAFLTSGQTDMLGGSNVAGEGGAATDGKRLFNGKVVLNGNVFKKMAPGFGQGPRYGSQGTQGQVVMHELGHALGLGHARHQTQIMYPAATRKKAEWGAGDWKGLKILGKGGCDQRPAAGPLVSRSLG